MNPTDAELRNPYMSDADRDAVLRALTAYRVRNLHVLEWGAGGSTFYFPDMLRRYRFRHNWTAIEHDPLWAAACASVKWPMVTIKLFDYGVTDQETLWTMPMDEYVGYPATLGRQWHVILIDGRKRRRCLVEARRLLKPDGVVLLHDADREYYRAGMDGYSGEFLTDTLWMGRVDETVGIGS
jgi:hypothetical protein